MQNQNLSVEVSKLKRDLKAVQKKFDESESKCERLKIGLTQTMNELDDLEVVETQEKIKKIEAENSQLRKNLKDALAELKRINDDDKCLRNSCHKEKDDLKKETENVKIQFEKSCEEIKKLEAEVKSLTAKLDVEVRVLQSASISLRNLFFELFYTRTLPIPS